MNLTIESTLLLLYLRSGWDVPQRLLEDDLISELQDAGYIDDSLKVTTSGKERIANHILKEKSLPNYVDLNSLPVAFDKFFSTASTNAVNAMLIALLNHGSIIGAHPVTLRRLQEEIAKEQKRQSAVDRLDLDSNVGGPRKQDSTSSTNQK